METRIIGKSLLAVSGLLFAISMCVAWFATDDLGNTIDHDAMSAAVVMVMLGTIAAVGGLLTRDM